MEDGFPDDERGDQGLGGLGSPHFAHQNGERVERYSRKVFVGGLPPDIDEGIGNSRVKFYMPPPSGANKEERVNASQPAGAELCVLHFR